MDELNTARPLSISNKVNQSLELSVLCKEQPVRGKPAVGRFLRCSQDGHITLHSPEYPQNYQQFAHTFEFLDFYWSLSFVRKVEYILAAVSLRDGCTALYQTTPDYAGNIFNLPTVGIYYIPFKGQTIYFRAEGGMLLDVSLMIRGYYF